MAQNDIGIDLGTTTIIIAQAGQGVVLNQPSVVAMDTRKNSVLEVGDKALAMVGRTPNYISAIFPLKDGVISDHTMTRELICRFVNQVYSSHMVKPRVAVCVPAAITGIESDAVVEAVMAAGARQVYLIDEPIAAALGSGIDITQPDGRMIIDIGGGTTDIAVLSLGGKVKATSVRVAGNHYDDEILKHVRNKFSIAIGDRTAEELKKTIGQKMQGTQNSAAAGQMKMLNFMMPLMSLYFAFILPGAIGIYWIFNNVFTCVQEIILTKTLRGKQEAKQAAEAARIEAEKQAKREAHKAAQKQQSQNAKNKKGDK